MEIRFTRTDKDFSLIKYKDSIDEMKDVIKEGISKYGLTDFNYHWREDGSCWKVFDDEDIVNECHSADEMVEMMAERVKKFGTAMVWSVVWNEDHSVGVEYEINVWDMNNEAYMSSTEFMNEDYE